MKVRNGFVSNSSSSSFVLLGVKNPKFLTDPPTMKKFAKEVCGIDTTNPAVDWEDQLWEVVYDEKLPKPYSEWAVINDDGPVYFGTMVSRDYDYGLEQADFSIAELMEISEKMAKSLNVEIERIKLYAGTMMT